MTRRVEQAQQAMARVRARSKAKVQDLSRTGVCGATGFALGAWQKSRAAAGHPTLPTVGHVNPFLVYAAAAHVAAIAAPSKMAPYLSGAGDAALAIFGFQTGLAGDRETTSGEDFDMG